MSDPVGLMGGVGGGGGVDPARGAGRAGAGGAAGRPGGAEDTGFKDVLVDQLRRVNELQADATKAIEDLQTGKRDDLPTVLLATQKADTAFRMLLATRNKVMEAYEEIRQIRV